MNLTSQQLKSAVAYDPETGVFTRRCSGKVAGSVHVRRKYIYLGIGYDIYLAHRLAWLYMTGEWPEHEIDHVDGNPVNNRWANLRDVPKAINCQNRREAQKNNTTRTLGVSFRSGRWIARLTTGNKTAHIGCFSTKDEASAAYVAAKRATHAGCTI